MKNNIKFLDYPKLIKSNLLNVIKYALKKTSEYGLSDEHHFYITFKTNFEKNKIPEYLNNDYPDTMMIVIENEYWNLKTYEDYFSIDLKFKGKIETLCIYFSSLKTFVDPSVSFTLNLDIAKSDHLKKKKTTKVNEAKQKKPQIENKSNVIFLKPNSN